MDAQGTYYIAKGFSVLASGQNMNNEVFGFYNGSPKYMTQREYYKPTFSLACAGIRITSNNVLGSKASGRESRQAQPPP